MKTHSPYLQVSAVGHMSRFLQNIPVRVPNPPAASELCQVRY